MGGSGLKAKFYGKLAEFCSRTRAFPCDIPNMMMSLFHDVITLAISVRLSLPGIGGDPVISGLSPPPPGVQQPYMKTICVNWYMSQNVQFLPYF